MTYTPEVQLSNAITMGLATLAHNARPKGWREADFETLLAWVSPDCPPLYGEVVGPQWLIRQVSEAELGRLRQVEAMPPLFGKVTS